MVVLEIRLRRMAYISTGISREINEMHGETVNEARQRSNGTLKKVATSDAEFAIVEIKRDSLFLDSNIRINRSTFFSKRLLR